MRTMRLALLAALAVVMVAGASWAGNLPPADALLLFHDGRLVIGDVFTVNRQTVSLRTEDGIFSYQRSEVSQVVFIAGHTLVLRAEGQFIDEETIVGELNYVGGLWDGRPAGRFSQTLETDPGDPRGERLLMRSTFTVERNTLPRGTIESLVVSGGPLMPDAQLEGWVQGHLAGVVTGGGGEFEGGHGTVEVIAKFNLEAPAVDSVSYFIFRYDDIDP